MAVSAVSVPHERSSAARYLPLGGVGFVLLVVLAFVALSGDTPGSEDSAASIRSFYDAHHAREIASALVVAAAAPLLVLFGSSLASALWPTEGGRRPFWQIALTAGSGLAGATWILCAAMHFAVADAAHQDGVSGAAVQALNVLDVNSWVAFNSGMGVLMLGAGGALLARRVQPVLAWIALVDAILLFIPYADFFGLIASGLWVMGASVLLFRRGEAFAAR
jgi:hypothetical protein